MPKRYSIAEARDRLPGLVHETEGGHHIQLTRRGKPVAVLLSLTDYERLAARRSSLFEAIIDFRDREHVEELDIDPCTLVPPRDASPGREVAFE